jgi:hypothetical protein
MGRPLKPIDADQVYRLARLGCTQDEIADVFGVHQATISRRFASEFARARSECRISLRRAQFRRAIEDRSDSMLIHLGKVYLGQGERSNPSEPGLSVPLAYDEYGNPIEP